MSPHLNCRAVSLRHAGAKPAPALVPAPRFAHYDCFTAAAQNVTGPKAASKTAAWGGMGQQPTGLSNFADAIAGERPDGDAISAAVDRARAQWQRYEAERLAEAEAAWTAKAEKRLSISRIGAQRAELALEQMRRRLEKVEAELAARIAESARVREEAEAERARWMQSPMAAQAKKAARDLQLQRRAKIALQLTRDFAWGVLVVALALLAAQRAVPVATGVWNHETGSQSVIKPLLRQAGIETDRLPHGIVAVSSAKLRAHPSSAAWITASLARGARVTLLGRRGKWMLVRAGESGEHQGWTPASALEAAPP